MGTNRFSEQVHFLVVTGKVHYPILDPGTFLYLDNRLYQVWKMVYLGLEMDILKQNEIYKNFVIADHTLA